MRIVIGVFAVLVLAFNLIKPSLNASDVLGMVVIVPCLTAALYGAFGELGGK